MRVALDVSLRHYDAPWGEARTRWGPRGLRFMSVWIGHYVRF